MNGRVNKGTNRMGAKENAPCSANESGAGQNSTARKDSRAHYDEMAIASLVIFAIATFFRKSWEPIVSFGLTWVLGLLHIIKI